MRLKPIPLFLFAVLAVSLSGCAGGKATVTGKVSLQGKQLEWGTVVMQGPDGVSMTAMIQPDGKYTIEGVESGTVKIAVISRDHGGRSIAQGKRGRSDKEPDTGTAAAPPAPAAPLPKWFPIPAKYEDVNSSGLTAKIKAGSNEHNIDLQ